MKNLTPEFSRRAAKALGRTRKYLSFEDNLAYVKRFEAGDEQALKELEAYYKAIRKTLNAKK